MLENIIYSQLGENLKKYPPFSFLSISDLENLSKNIKVKFFSEKEVIFREETESYNYFFFIQKGSIELLWHKNEKEEIIEICDTGEIFGIKAILGNRKYLNTARAHEDSLLLIISFESFKFYLENNPKVALYFAAGFSSEKNHKISEIRKIEIARKELNHFHHHINIDDPDKSISFITKEIIKCNKNTNIQSAAKLMTEKNSDSILIVDEEFFPIGIVTDVDLRAKVVSNNISLNTNISEIMNSPVVTVSKDISYYKATILMLKNKIRHLCITEDSSTNSKSIGIISEHDIFLNQIPNPLFISKEIVQSNNISEVIMIAKKIDKIIEYYIKQDLSISYLLEVISEVNDLLIIKIIELSKIQLENMGMEDTGLKYAWIALGSEGRKEQVLKTDQDNALLYEDPLENKKDYAKSYFLELGKLVTQYLNQCGFAYCPGNIMASNPNLCRPISEWKNLFYQWIHSGSPQSILNCSIFFDFRAIYGSTELTDELEFFIQKQIDSNKNILRFMSLNSISNTPPLGIFRNFVLEKHGKHKNEFDIKIRGITPLIELARILSLENKISERSTIYRFEKLSHVYQNHKNEFREGISAFEVLTRLRLINSIENSNSKNFINPNTLSKMEKDILKHTFEIIRDLQKYLEIHFQVNLLQR